MPQENSDPFPIIKTISGSLKCALMHQHLNENPAHEVEGQSAKVKNI